MSDKIVVVHQPDFIPYLGFFDRLLYADIYVVFDNVQYVRSSRGWTSRDKIKTRNGEKWISISTKAAARDTDIKEIMLAEDDSWKQNHLNIIRECYKKAPFYDEIMPYIEALYSFECTRMMDFTMQSIKMLLTLFEIDTEIVYASSLNVSGKSNVLIADIMHKLNEKIYLSGTGAEDYYDAKVYEEAGIKVVWQDFSHPVYPQQFGDFIPYLSSIDLLFNCGIKKSREILKSNSHPPKGLI